MLARGGVDPITADELTVLPGVDEVLALLAVRELALTGDWDALVVDCAPTAETLRLLALPEALTWYLQRVFPAQRRIARSMRPIAALLGRGEAMPPDTLFEALLRLNDELAAVRQLLGDPAVTSVRLVLTPEAVVAAEARRTFTALALYGYGVDLVDRQPGLPGRRRRVAAGLGRGPAAAARAAIRESFAGLPVRELAYRPAEPVGAGALREVADALYGELPGDDPAPPSPAAELLRVEHGGEEFVLRMALPLAERGRGRRRPGRRRPRRHRRAEPPGADPAERAAALRGRPAAEFDGRELRVRFRPDPALLAGAAAAGEPAAAEPGRGSARQPDDGRSDGRRRRRCTRGWPSSWPRCRTGRADAFAGAPAERHSPAPSAPWCPLCQFAGMLRGEHPEVTERVAEAGAALAGAMKALSRRPRWPGRQADRPDAARNGRPSPAPRVQHIRPRRARRRPDADGRSRSASTSAAPRWRPAWSTSEGAVIDRERRDTPGNDVAGTEASSSTWSRTLAARHDVAAVGIGAAGWIANDHATVLFSPHLAWRDEPLRDALAERIELPLIVENDANAAAWAEYRFGAARERAGRRLRHARHRHRRRAGRRRRGLPRRVRHRLRVRPHDARARRAAVRLRQPRLLGDVRLGPGAGPRRPRAGRASRRWPRPRMLELAGSVEALTGPVVTAAAAAGDPAAQSICTTMGRWLGRGLANLAAVIDPSMFVIGGGVSAAGELLLRPAREEFAHTLTGRGFRPVARVGGRARPGRRAGRCGRPRPPLRLRRCGRHRSAGCPCPLRLLTVDARTRAVTGRRWPALIATAEVPTSPACTAARTCCGGGRSRPRSAGRPGWWW